MSRNSSKKGRRPWLPTGGSPEQNPAKRLEAERYAYRKLSDSQRSRSLARQINVGRFGWLVLIAFLAASVWMYVETVNRTTVRNQIALLQTLATEGEKEMVLSVTTSDGANIKGLVKLPKSQAPAVAAQEPVSIEKVSTWELEKLATALSVGDQSLPIGIALKIADQLK